MDNPRGSIPWQARATCGFILAPIIAALLLELPSMLARDPSLPAYIAYLLKVGYLALLVLGVPAYLLARRLRWSGLAAYVAFGALLGLRDVPGHLCGRRAPGRAGSSLRSIGQASLSSSGRAVRGARPGRFLADCQAGPALITHSPLPSTPLQQPFDRQPALDVHAEAPKPPRFRLGRIGFALSAIFPPEVCFVLQGYPVGYVGKGSYLRRAPAAPRRWGCQ